MTKRYVIIDESKITSKDIDIELGPVVLENVTETMKGFTALKQAATWKSALSHDGYSQTFAEVDIRCRYIPQQKLILQADGTYRQSSAKMIVVNDIKDGDRIEYNGLDSVVLATKDRVGLGGSIIEREIWV